MGSNIADLFFFSVWLHSAVPVTLLVSLLQLWDALINNLVAVGVGLLAVIIYIIAVVASGDGSLQQVVNFLMALSYTYGVLIITVLMGSGLISLPRQLW